MLDRWYKQYRTPPPMTVGEREVHKPRGLADKSLLARRIYLMEYFLLPIYVDGDPEPHGNMEEAWDKWVAAMDRENKKNRTSSLRYGYRPTTEARIVFQAVDSITPFS